MINVVAALIISDDKFLVSKRAYGSLKGYWEFPGGKIEEDETEFEAIIREIREELNFTIVPKEIIEKFVHEYAFGTVNLTLIKCKLEDNITEILSDGSHSEFCWTSVKEKPKRFAPLDKKIWNYLKKTYMKHNLQKSAKIE